MAVFGTKRTFGEFSSALATFRTVNLQDFRKFRKYGW